LNSGGESTDTIDLEAPQYGVSYPLPFDQLALALCQSASRYIRIISPQLDHVVFDNSELVDAISALARRDRHSEVRILISDSTPIVHTGHRLLNLARRLPNSVIIRKLVDHPEMTGETVVIRDLSGLLYTPAGEGLGFYEPDSPASARQFIEKFDPLWQRAVDDPNFRRLGI
jgi:hypothetical protein